MKVNVLIDSFGWIEHFSDGPMAPKYANYVKLASKKTHFTPSVVLYEVYKKLKRLKGEQIALVASAHMIGYTVIIPLSKKLSLEAAEISLEQGLSMADSIIMATAKLTKSEIITSDGHFRGKENVIFIAKKEEKTNSDSGNDSQKAIAKRMMERSKKGLFKLPKDWKFNRDELYDRK